MGRVPCSKHAIHSRVLGEVVEHGVGRRSRGWFCDERKSPLLELQET